MIMLCGLNTEIKIPTGVSFWLDQNQNSNIEQFSHMHIKAASFSHPCNSENGAILQKPDC